MKKTVSAILLTGVFAAMPAMVAAASQEENNQDCLYTLYLQGMKKGEAVREHEVINSISRGLNPYKEYEQYLKIAEQSEIRFVISNTTEAGIAFDENDKL